MFFALDQKDVSLPLLQAPAKVCLEEIDSCKEKRLLELTLWFARYLLTTKRPAVLPRKREYLWQSKGLLAEQRSFEHCYDHAGSTSEFTLFTRSFQSGKPVMT